jgi:WD40 repeat protein
VAQTWEAEGSYPGTAGFSPDGALLATGSVEVRLGEHFVTVRDWRMNEQVTTLETYAEGLAFSPDGSKLATAHIAGAAYLWDPRTGRRLVTLAGHTGAVTGVSFSYDGATVATAGEDGTVRLWDAETGVQQLALPGHTNVAHHVRFSPDGTKLASSGADGVARVWALDLDDLSRIAQENVTRDLTPAECRQYLHVDTCP